MATRAIEGGQLRNFEISGKLCSKAFFVHKVKCSYDVPVSNPVTRNISHLEAKAITKTGFETGMP